MSTRTLVKREKRHRDDRKGMRVVERSRFAHGKNTTNAKSYDDGRKQQGMEIPKVHHPTSYRLRVDWRALRHFCTGTVHEIV